MQMGELIRKGEESARASNDLIRVIGALDMFKLTHGGDRRADRITGSPPVAITLESSATVRDN